MYVHTQKKVACKLLFMMKCGRLRDIRVPHSNYIGMNVIGLGRALKWNLKSYSTLLSYSFLQTVWIRDRRRCVLALLL